MQSEVFTVTHYTETDLIPTVFATRESAEAFAESLASHVPGSAPKVYNPGEPTTREDSDHDRQQHRGPRDLATQLDAARTGGDAPDPV